MTAAMHHIEKAWEGLVELQRRLGLIADLHRQTETQQTQLCNECLLAWPCPTWRFVNDDLPPEEEPS